MVRKFNSSQVNNTVRKEFAFANQQISTHRLETYAIEYIYCYTSCITYVNKNCFALHKTYSVEQNHIRECAREMPCFNYTFHFSAHCTAYEHHTSYDLSRIKQKAKKKRPYELLFQIQFTAEQFFIFHSNSHL